MERELLKHCVSIDIETTGLDESKHSIIEIGACNFADDDTFFVELSMPNSFVYDENALKVNGHSVEGLKSRSYPQYCSISLALLTLQEYLDMRGLGILIGKNPSFDYRFLLHNFLQATKNTTERNFFLSYRTINWADMAIPLMLKSGIEVPKRGFSSDQISEFLGLEPEPKPHNALNGAIHNKKAVSIILDKFDKLFN